MMHEHGAPGYPGRDRIGAPPSTVSLWHDSGSQNASMERQLYMCYRKIVFFVQLRARSASCIVCTPGEDNLHMIGSSMIGQSVIVTETAELYCILTLHPPASGVLGCVQ